MSFDPMSSLPVVKRATNETLAVALSARHPARDSGGQPRVGEPHYSLHLSASRLAAAVSLAGWDPELIARPEIFGSDVARRFLAANGQPIIHLASGDFGSLRLLKGAYNIAYVAWEYEWISGRADPMTLSFWKDQVRVLNLFDEIWVGATFVKSAFESAGVHNVYIVPAPTPLIDENEVLSLDATIGDASATCLYLDFSSDANTKSTLRELTAPARAHLGAFRSERRRIILTIINPGDPRKNMAATILGFLEIAAEFPDAVLLVKLVVPTGATLEEAIWDPLRLKFRDYLADGLLKSRQVIFIGDAWDELRLQSLIANVDFYVSTSFAEGLNLPVLEAMARRTVTICPIHTAMIDYLDESACIPCAYHPLTVDGRLATGYPIEEVTRYNTTANDVAVALREALFMPQDRLAGIREQGARIVSERYDTPAVARAIAERIGAAEDRLRIRATDRQA